MQRATVVVWCFTITTIIWSSSLSPPPPSQHIASSVWCVYVLGKGILDKDYLAKPSLSYVIFPILSRFMCLGSRLMSLYIYSRQLLISIQVYGLQYYLYFTVCIPKHCTLPWWLTRNTGYRTCQPVGHDHYIKLTRWIHLMHVYVNVSP